MTPSLPGTAKDLRRKINPPLLIRLCPTIYLQDMREEAEEAQEAEEVEEEEEERTRGNEKKGEAVVERRMR